jgi:hypothetical protein
MYPAICSSRTSGVVIAEGGVMTTVEVNGVTLGVEYFGTLPAVQMANHLGKPG